MSPLIYIQVLPHYVKLILLTILTILLESKMFMISDQIGGKFRLWYFMNVYESE